MCSKSIKLCKRAACLRWIPLNNLFIYLLSHNALMLQCFNVFCFLLFNVCSIRHSKSNKIFTLTHLLVLAINIMVIVIVVASIRTSTHTHIHTRTHYLKLVHSPKWCWTYGQHCTYTLTCGSVCGWLMLLVKPQTASSLWIRGQSVNVGAGALDCELSAKAHSEWFLWWSNENKNDTNIWSPQV